MNVMGFLIEGPVQELLKLGPAQYPNRAAAVERVTQIAHRLFPDVIVKDEPEGLTMIVPPSFL